MGDDLKEGKDEDDIDEVILTAMGFVARPHEGKGEKEEPSLSSCFFFHTERGRETDEDCGKSRMVYARVRVCAGNLNT